jgi:hypothetical protein
VGQVPSPALQPVAVGRSVGLPYVDVRGLHPVSERAGRRCVLGLIVLLLGGAESGVSAADFYASPSGTTSTGVGTGTIANPWALKTALAQPAAVRPGDTIWLRGGTYTGQFTSYLTGTSSQPIVVRPYAGERATLDGNTHPTTPGNGINLLTVNGGYTWFWGIELTNSCTIRYNPTPGSNPVDARGEGFFILAPGIKVINCVIHDTGEGIGAFSGSDNAELYGNIIYYNGWDAPDRGHGHGIYAQNLAGTGSKLIKHNIMFEPFGNNLDVYGSSASAFVNSTVQENVWFRGDSLLGGNSGFDLGGSKLTGNYGWDGGNVLGYYSQHCNPTTISGNYIANTAISSILTPPYDPLGRVGMTIATNTMVGDLDGFTQADYPNNTYYSKTSPPTVGKVVVLPNVYEPGRATIAVYNWDKSATHAVDLTGIVSPGAAYEIRNAQNFYGLPVVSGTYAGGSVTLPMTALTPATPVGFAVPPPTGPGFNTFVVLTAVGSPETDSHADCDADAGSHADTDPGSHSRSDRYADSDADPYFDSDSDAYADGDAHSHTHSHTHADARVTRFGPLHAFALPRGRHAGGGRSLERAFPGRGVDPGLHGRGAVRRAGERAGCCRERDGRPPRRRRVPDDLPGRRQPAVCEQR